MPKKGFDIVLVICLLLQAMISLGQDSLMYVVVMDGDGNNMPYFRLSINGDDQFLTSEKGAFSYNADLHGKPESIIAIQDGYIVSSWSVMGQDKIEVMVKKSQVKLITGTLLLDSGKPAVNTDIVFKDTQPFQLASTDSLGNFQLFVPSTVKIDQNSLFSIKDFEVIDQDFEFKGFYEFTVVISAIPTFKIPGKLYQGIVTDTKNDPIANHRVTVGNIDYMSDEKGFFKAIVIDPDAKYQVESHKIKAISSSELGDIVYIKVFESPDIAIEQPQVVTESLMVFQQPPLLSLDNIITDSSNVVEDIKSIVSKLGKDNEELSEKNARINEILNKINSKIKNNPDAISQESKDTIKVQLAELERLMQEYDELDKQYSDTRSIVDELRRSLLEKEDLMLLMQQEKDAEAKKLRKQFLIAMGASLLISIIALSLLFLTYRLRKQKATLRTQKKEISDVKLDLEDTLSELELTHGQLKKENENRKDSIRYAQTIQNAVLPSTKSLDSCFEDYFVLFRPKDIVSGDFYWFSNGQTENGHQVSYIAVADCTGHGVPGAFMSLIGTSVLNEIINKRHISETHEILEILDKQIIKALKQEEKQNDDGMDICLCKLEKFDDTVTKVTFTGAKRPLYYIKHRTQALEYSKGDNKSIGGTLGKKRDFTSETLFLESGDSLYLTSDGMPDQHGPNNRKLGKQRFAELVKAGAANSMAEQKVKLELALEEHQQNQVQRDDITVVGIKV